MPRTPTPQVQKRTSDSETTPPGVDRPLVLVIEDDWDIREAVQDVLVDAGFVCVCLNDGRRGLEYLLRGEQLPAVILLDLMMPRMDGWTFFETLRATPGLKDIPVVVFTAAGPHGGYPTTHVLHKPIHRRDLLAAVRDAIEGTKRGGPR
jgi:two-component system, chemotaxis family, chemotaxis protein CheY